MKSYADLDIYKILKSLAIRVHEMTLSLPRFETYEEGSQVRRSSKAITSVIVEGYGRRNYKAEFIRYLTIAHAECDETIVHLQFLYETRSLASEQLFTELCEEYHALSKRIFKFLQWVIKSWNPGTWLLEPAPCLPCNLLPATCPSNLQLAT
jgi:four helix bundle protein